MIKFFEYAVSFLMVFITFGFVVYIILMFLSIIIKLFTR